MCVCVCVCVCVCICIHIYIYLYIYIYMRVSVCQTPLTPAGCDTRSFLSGILLVWIQIFLYPRLVVIPRLNNQSVRIFSTSLGAGKKSGFIPFTRALARSEMHCMLICMCGWMYVCVYVCVWLKFIIKSTRIQINMLKLTYEYIRTCIKKSRKNKIIQIWWIYNESRRSTFRL